MTAISTGEFLESSGKKRRVYIYNSTVCGTDDMPYEKRKHIYQNSVVCDSCKKEIMDMKSIYPELTYFQRMKIKLKELGIII